MNVSQATEEFLLLATALFPRQQDIEPTPELNSEKLKNGVEDMLKRQNLPVDIKLGDARLPGSHSKV